MIENVSYKTLDVPSDKINEFYFLQNAIGISSRFIDEYIAFETELAHKRNQLFQGERIDFSKIKNGVSIIKGKYIVIGPIENL